MIDLKRSFWEMPESSLREFANAEEYSFTKPLGDISIGVLISNQKPLLAEHITRCKLITNNIFFLDDHSTDGTLEEIVTLGYRVYSLPEGWIYTKGFGKASEQLIRCCDTKYCLQLDVGEKPLLHPGIQTLTEEKYVAILRLNFEGTTFRQPIQRIFNTQVPNSYSEVIHQGTSAEYLSSNPARYNLALVHYAHATLNFSQLYQDRKNRLYFKLLRKGAEQGGLTNPYWIKLYQDNKQEYDRIVAEIENRIGILEETNEEIRLVSRGNL
jgi:hypothetical protein